jgi:hypothetical protein
VLHRIIDKRSVLSWLFIKPAVQVILNKASIHFAVTLTSSVSIVLLHAVLWAGFYAIEKGSCKEELAPLTSYNDSEAYNSDAV